MERNQANGLRARQPTLAPGGAALAVFDPWAVSWETRPAGDETGRFLGETKLTGCGRVWLPGGWLRQ